MNPTRREALLAMGYREVQPKRWLKPVGYVCFSYTESSNEWANWFLDAQGKIACWERKSFEDNPERYGYYIHQLKEFECWTRMSDFYINGNSQFHLRAIDI